MTRAVCPRKIAADITAVTFTAATSTSPYRNWYYLPATDKPGLDTPGDDNTKVYCAPHTTYEAWYGYSSLPKLQANTNAVRQLIWSDPTGACHTAAPTTTDCPVAKYWTALGADGWHFDVGGDVDPGLTNNLYTHMRTNSKWYTTMQARRFRTL